MEKLTEFVTNSFVDKEVKFTPTKGSPKLEPLSPHNNYSSGGGGSRNSASASPEAEGKKTPHDRNPHFSATINYLKQKRGDESDKETCESPTDDKKELGKVTNNNNNIISNQNREETLGGGEKASKSVRKGK